MRLTSWYRHHPNRTVFLLLLALTLVCLFGADQILMSEHNRQVGVDSLRQLGHFPLVVRRMALFCLGLAMFLSCTTAYIVSMQRSADLEEQNAQLTAQAENAQLFNNRLIRLTRELDDFAYVVSHDLKEPLRGVEGLTRLLLQEHGEKLDPGVREYVLSIRDSGKRMRRLVDDLLRLSRIGRRQYPRERVDFNDLLAEVRHALDYAIAQKQATVAVQPGLPTLICDRVRMAELFQNLVSNALKFTPGKPPRVEIGYRLADGEHLFWVQDNGIGIRPEHHERIFEIFQRLDPGGPQEGTGVGLTICKRIVEGHGGHMKVESRLGEGARFLVALPVQPSGGDAVPLPVEGHSDGRTVERIAG